MKLQPQAPMPKTVPDLFLASTSPRRLELLSQAGLKFHTLAPQVDETPVRGESGRAMVARLAREKALSVLGELGARAVIVIAADTTVVAPTAGSKAGKILGKPTDSGEAFKMLKSLQGKTHTVFTGYCLAAPGKKPWVRVVQTHVTMRKLSVQQMQVYAGLAEPMDKAGAYAAQGLGQALIEEIRGSYSNVVGLPVAQVLQDLEAQFHYRPFLA